MKKTLIGAMGLAFVAALALTASAQQAAQGDNGTTDQTFEIGQKIMGYDVAPGTGQDGQHMAGMPDIQNAVSAETGLGVYRGVVFGNYSTARSGDEIACDFGSTGVWVHDGSWHQISGANAEMMVAGTIKDATHDELIGDFGSLGLWMWEYTGGYPGTWTQLSGVNAMWEFVSDADGNSIQELFAAFSALGIWQYNYSVGWRQASTLYVDHGLRMDTYALGSEEGGFSFYTQDKGLWRIWGPAGYFYFNQLTGTSTSEDDMASARFRNGTAEDLVVDFAGLGLWLLTDQSHTDWHQISSDNVSVIKVVQFGTDNPGLVIIDNYKSGLWYWHYSGSFPGTEVQINATTPASIFIEPCDYTWGDGDQELLVDYGTSGLYVYEYYGGVWTQLSTLNPTFMVAGDYWADGVNTGIIASFGASGLWLYDGLYHNWYQLSGLSPDFSTF